MKLPQWLDDYIFNELGAKYQPSYSDMTNIHDDKEKTLNYLGTYFPRSYVEAYCIFSDYFENHKSEWENRTHISVFDFGCGTGGEIIGLLTVLSEKLPKLEKVRIVGLDGNQFALRLLEKTLEKFKIEHELMIEFKASAITIDDFYDLKILNDIITNKFDVIVSFKAICEFVTEQQFEEKNAYEHIASFLMPKLEPEGILLLEDVTTFNNKAEEWLPKMMDKGLDAAEYSIIERNVGYNQKYTITHSRRALDISKTAWRIINKE